MMSIKITNVALLFVLFVCTIVVAWAQTPTGKSPESILPSPRLEYVGSEKYVVHGRNAIKHKLRITNRASYPDYLWSRGGKNKGPSRMRIVMFGSSSEGGISGCEVCAENLNYLWFDVRPGEKASPCVYIVMTDRHNGKQYTSNRVCSRLFTALKPSGSQQAKELEAGMKEFQAEKEKNKQSGAINGGFGWDRIAAYGPANGVIPDSKPPVNKKASPAQADLIVKQFLFPPTNNKALRVLVANTGSGASGACRLFITVRKINGIPAGRRTHVNVPALAAGADVWLVIDARRILPNNVSLESTTFRLNIDATEIVAESNESNNELWHNQ
jgi:CARDB